MIGIAAISKIETQKQIILSIYLHYFLILNLYHQNSGKLDLRISQIGLEKIYNQEKTDVVQWFENYKDMNKDNAALQESDLAVYSIGIMKNDIPDGKMNFEGII